jgi:hypothetical protein
MATSKFNPNLRKAERQAIGQFEYVPPRAAWLDSLDQNPVVSPNFADTVKMRADWFVWEWMKENAPPEILELHRAADGLGVYFMEFQASKGFVSEDSNTSVIDHITRAVNALDKIGDDWTNTTP